jgi:hypothetical protein
MNEVGPRSTSAVSLAARFSTVGHQPSPVISLSASTYSGT